MLLITLLYLSLHLVTIRGMSAIIGDVIDSERLLNSHNGPVQTNSEMDVYRKDNEEIIISSDYIYDTPKTVKLKNTMKEDRTIENFSNHVYGETIKLLDALKHKTSNNILKDKVELLKENYKDEFKDFIRVSKEQKLRTVPGMKDVIQSIVEHSYRILRRLAKQLLDDVVDGEELESKSIVKEIELGEPYQQERACKELNICRSVDSYKDFFVAFINKILNNEDYKLKQVPIELAKILKNMDEFYGVPIEQILTEKSVTDYYNNMEQLEKLNPRTLRHELQFIRNVLAYQSNTVQDTTKASKELAFVKLIETINEFTPSTAKNHDQWNFTLKQMDDWTSGKNKNLSEIFQMCIRQIFMDLIFYATPEVRQQVMPTIIQFLSINQHHVQEIKNSESELLTHIYEY